MAGSGNKRFVFDELGSPLIFPLAWHNYAVEYPVQVSKRSANPQQSWVTIAELKPDPSAGQPCPICGKLFSASQMQGHLRRVHGHKKPYRVKIAGTKCKSCMKQIWDRPRLLHHISHRSKVCKAFYCARAPLEDPEAVALAEEAHKIQQASLRKSGLRQNHAEISVLRLVGPLPPRPRG